jgi:hypothetical protein
MTTLAEKRQSREVAALQPAGDVIEDVLIRGDLKSLNAEQRNQYYLRLCHVTGLNPLTQPFEYLTLNGKLVLYARKSCTDQLRALHQVSVVDMDQEEREGLYSVTVKVRDKHGREDMDIGSVNIGGLKGEARANAIMKASTKAKRRATLSICGLGLLDETEVETIPGAVSHPEAAGGEPDPQSPPRQQPPVNASQAKKADVWPRFVEKLRGFTDLDELERWWSSASTQKAVDEMPGTWPEQAHEEYEKKQEALMNAGRP